MNPLVNDLNNLSNFSKIDIAQYYTELLNTGINAVKGNQNYIWMEFERFSTVRFPEINTIIPNKKEIDRILKKQKSMILNYVVMPDHNKEANSIIYLCTNASYNKEELSKNVRRDINIATRHLDIGFVEWEEILSNGSEAFKDTRTRVRLSDGNDKEFIKRFREFSENKAHVAVAAKLGNQIIAFMSLIIMEDFVIIQGSFSSSKYKKYCPTNGLVDFVLKHFLVDNSFKIVSYGLSSIQEQSSKEGLHNYKQRVGFQAIPVRRAFILHPLLKPFKGILGLSLRMLLLLFPNNRSLKKASGIMESLRSR